MYVQKGLDGAPEVLLDPNAWSADGTVQLPARSRRRRTRHIRGLWHLEQRFRLAGQYKVMELANGSGRFTTTRSNWVKVSTVAWAGQGLLTTAAIREPAAGHTRRPRSNENHQSLLPRSWGPSSQKDKLVYEDAKNPQRFHVVYATEDERFAILDLSERGKGTDGNALHVRDLTKPDQPPVPAPLIPEITERHDINVVDDVGGRLLVADESRTRRTGGVVIDRSRSTPREANWRTAHRGGLRPDRVISGPPAASCS